MAFDSFDEYAESVEAIATAGDLPDYTYLWWDVRPHPVLGTIEVRAMDAQSSLRTVTGLVALVHALARRAAEEHGPWERREVLMESSFRAARDGLGATISYDGTMRPVPEVARAAIALARPYARELGSEAELEVHAIAVNRQAAECVGRILGEGVRHRDDAVRIVDELARALGLVEHRRPQSQRDLGDLRAEGPEKRAQVRSPRPFHSSFT